MAFGGRYLLIMMGSFAMYAGLIYNDCVSVPMNIFQTGWTFDKAGQGQFTGTVYPIGIDPNWHHTANELAFFNSMKMKLSVTLGVTQMVFGICLGFLNDMYFGETTAIL
jgi:V-type H+-transporting ATPase subunit a